MSTYTVHVDGMANGHAVTFALPCRDMATAQKVADILNAKQPRQRVIATVYRNLTRAERMARGIQRATAGHYGYGLRIIKSTLTRGNVMTNYVDADTLAIARLVAEAEGITLAEAIRDQIELFSN